MFDFENPFGGEALPVENDVADAEWDQITDAHAAAEDASGRAGARHNAERSRREMFDNFYEKSEQRRKERTGVTAARYAVLAIGLASVAYLVRDMAGLALTLGGIAMVLGLIAAYGAGKCREM